MLKKQQKKTISFEGCHILVNDMSVTAFMVADFPTLVPLGEKRQQFQATFIALNLKRKAVMLP